MFTKGGGTCCLGGSNEPTNFKKKKNIYIYIYNNFLLVYFMLKNIFAYFGWNLTHLDHRSVQPKTKQQLEI